MNERLKSVAMEKLSAIEKVVSTAINSNEIYYGNLSCGTAGAALMYTELYRLYNSERYLDMVYKIVENIFSDKPFDHKFYSHCGGLAGEAWLLCHLIDGGILDRDSYEAIAGGENFLFMTMDELLKKGHYDFLHSGLGIAHFFLSNQYSEISKDQYLECVVSHLDHTAVFFPDGSVGWNDIDIESGKVMTNKYNFGLAHGIPSIIALLCQCYRRADDGPVRRRIYKLLEGSVKFITDRICKDVNTISLFPYSTEEGVRPDYNSRLGWCYGDMGVAIALQHASKILKSSDLSDIIESILIKSVSRKYGEEIRMNDASFCHGTAGLAHIYYSFYHQTGRQYLLESADYWIERTLTIAGFDDGFAGYKFFQPLQGGYINDYGLLNGVIGVGIALASALRETPCTWDNSFLITL